MPTNTMKAIRLHEFGGPEVLRYEEVRFIRHSGARCAGTHNTHVRSS